MKDDNGDVKFNEEEVRQIWEKYFENLLNVEVERETLISTICTGNRNESVMKGEAREKLKKM